MNIAIQKYKLWLIQFIKFSFVGVLNTLVSLVVYYLFLFIGFYYLISNAFGFLASVLNAYFCNRRFVFKSKAKTSSSFIKTFCVYALTFATGSIIMFLLVDRFMISEIIAPFIVIAVNVPINFLLIKCWAMK